MKVSKHFSFQILFLLCIVVSLFPNYELTFAIWFITFLITIKKKYSTTIFKYVFFFSCILLIAIISSIANQPRLFLIIRDLTYLLKPILGLLVGYQIFRTNSKLSLKFFVYTGLIIALMHIAIIFVAFLQYKSLSLNLLRSSGGYFSDYEIYVIIILIFNKELDLSISKTKIRLFLTIIVFSSLLYGARTNMIQIVVLFLAMKGYFMVNFRSVTVLLAVMTITIIGYSAIVAYNPKRSGKGLDAIMYKIKIAPEEAFKTHIDQDDWKDFNDNYRSFENIITVKQLSTKGTRTILFGEGLGSTLNLGRRVRSNDNEYVQYIPYVHNGFMTVFLKSGLLGVSFLLIFLILLFRQKPSEIYLVKQVNFLLIGTSIFLIVSNWVFLGLYLKLDNKSIIIGFLIAFREMVIKEHNNRKLIQNV
jgi:hypothetical protein